jgi:hypothetical protein
MEARRIALAIVGRLYQTPVKKPHLGIPGSQMFWIFPRNESANPTEYLSERPEMTTQ